MIAVFSVLALVLLAANALKYGWVHESFFVSHEKTIDGGTKLFGGLLLVLGSIASYFRFFRGRTFAARGEIVITVQVMEGSAGMVLHVIDIVFNNLGTVPIWKPLAELRIQAFGKPAVEPEQVTEWSLSRERDGVSRTAVVDPQENGLFHATREFPMSVWAVHYEVVIVSEADDAWHSMTTVSNRIKGGTT
ncbi:MAG: hypothetical protein ABI625_13955 [bacterium]